MSKDIKDALDREQSERDFMRALEAGAAEWRARAFDRFYTAPPSAQLSNDRLTRIRHEASLQMRNVIGDVAILRVLLAELLAERDRLAANLATITHTEPVGSVTDEQLGAAIRRIAQNLDPGWSENSFDYYARSMVSFAGTTEGLEPIERCRAYVSPPNRIDGLIEHLVEMVTGQPCSADPDE